MEQKGYLQKIASPDDGRVTYITVTESGHQLHQKYDAQYFPLLAPYMDEISEEDAETMIPDHLKHFIRSCGKGGIDMANDKTDFTQGSILKKLVAFMIPVLGALILQAAYGAVDLLVVGRYGSTSGLSAVSTGSQVLESGDLCGHTARHGNHRIDRTLSW